MVVTGEVIRSDVETDPDGDGTILTLQVRITDAEDNQSVELVRHAGVDYNPPVDSTVVIADVNSSYRLAIACDDGCVPEMAEGEYQIYGSDGGEKVSSVTCRNDGQVEVNGTGDWAVRFDALKAEFDALVAALKTHTHPGVVAGAASSGPPANAAAMLDLTDAVKAETVELPAAEVIP